MKGLSKFLASPHPWLAAKVAILLFVLAFEHTAWAFAGNVTSSLLGTVVQVVDPETIPNLYFEADLTPTHTIDVPGQGIRVVRGWGWGYDYQVCFKDAPTLITPLGAKYNNGQLTARTWTGWGIPGEIVSHSTTDQPPPTDPVETKSFGEGQKIYTRNLLPGVIATYNLDGDQVARALIWAWRSKNQICVKTWQVAIGHLVPADPNFYRTDVAAPEPTRPYDFSQFPGGKMETVHLTAGQTTTTSDGWVTTQWSADRFTVGTPKGKVIFNGGLYYLESTPYETNPWYLKNLGSTWDPSRLVGLSLCPYPHVVPMTYLWEGECP